MDYAGIDGFLGTRASLALDVVVVTMAGVLPVLSWSIYQVRYRQRYRLHKRVQLALGLVLAVIITLFEWDIRSHGWQERARAAPDSEVPWEVVAALRVHLVFAVSTAMLWMYVLVEALRKIPNPPGPCAYSAAHRFWARLAAADLVLTTVTGWIFYWLAFVRC